MSLTIFLDASPLGIVTNPKKPSVTIELLRWAADHIRAGNRIMVPAVADYEVRRELTRLGKTAGIASLDVWNGVPSDRYIPLSDAALRRASALWAQARNSGSATADSKELDCDVLIAAQMLEYQETHGIAPSEVVIATLNVGHLSQFVRADLFQNILPYQQVPDASSNRTEG